MQINVYVHHDQAIQIALDRILQHLRNIDCGASPEDQRLLDALNARTERQTRKLEKLEAKKS